jgi:Fungal specific transcription factor domain
MALGDIVTFHVIVLTSAFHYAALHSTTLCHTLDLLRLKQEAIASITRAMESVPADCIVNDHLIAAVAKMTSYEAMYGERALYHTHMTALLKMVHLRGGLESLGLGGLLARMVLWIDTNSAFLLNEGFYFQSSTFPIRQPLAPPNPGCFLGIS